MTEMTDWRMQGQDTYLLGLSLFKHQYRKHKDNWDHDHCEFCGAMFTESTPETLHSGYSTADSYYWICESCFEDFQATFKWKVQQ
ncbi:hypothetical protein FNL37_0743 [Methylovorus glucosotrophus]|nr:hypothetical protein FNL37_0743 [Methylovorus glucosotrophus]